MSKNEKTENASAAELIAGKRALRSLHDEIQALLDEKSRLEQKREALRNEIAALMDATDFSDEKLVNSIATKKGQVDLIPNKLGSIEKQIAQKRELTTPLGKRVWMLIEPVLRERLDKFLGDAAKAIRPFCASEEGAYRVAHSLSKASEMQETINLASHYINMDSTSFLVVVEELGALIDNLTEAA
jgi:chromosome segregation ATPase